MKIIDMYILLFKHFSSIYIIVSCRVAFKLVWVPCNLFPIDVFCFCF